MKTLLAKHQLETDMSEAEMNKFEADNRDEINALLKESYEAEARGEFAPLEPIEVFLERAHKRWKKEDKT